MFSFDLDYPADWYPYTWDCFSNTTFETKGLAKLPLLADSVEHPHNTVHLVLGSIGAMGDNDYAGFDPIFSLHHTQVDRLLAFWEHIYPNYWMGLSYMNNQGELKPFTDEEGTRAELPDASINENTTLNPFRQPGNSYWKASETCFMARMNYTYPAVQLSLGQDIGIAQWAADLAALHVTSLWILSSRHKVSSRVNPLRDKWAFSDKLAPAIFADDVTSKVPDGHTPVHGFHHFVFSVELLKFAFNLSYYLEFLYQKTEETTVPVGIVPVLGRGSSTLCAACNVCHAWDNKVHGVVTIDTDVMVDIVLKENLNHSHTMHDQIIDALKRNIWAHLATCSGGRIASPRYRDGQVSGAGYNTLAAEAIPKIIIASANLAERQREEVGEGGGKALSYYDTVQHAEHLTEGWS
ncbi:hypothetical protein DFH08DRAFT_970422 [Mycena albidolilacea]|uniref:tyrosinase n=1 Tax=Mycena albidolilacea TaxID=1033008 RepID=A0AAD6ZFJ9_9AGAR|nr:hypothetical protein DFH08DRAFT_970422 [Mycena albidolilacea]